MNKLIQVRGISGSGKSTAVRYFIDAHGLKEVQSIETPQGLARCTITQDGMAVLGVYPRGKKFGGCDSFKNAAQVRYVLHRLMREGHPAIVFEGLIYSFTFEMAYRLWKEAPSYGYEYHALFMVRTPEDAAVAKIGRNGCAAKIPRLENDWVRAEVAIEKLRRSGVPVHYQDTEATPLELAGGRHLDCIACRG